MASAPEPAQVAELMARQQAEEMRSNRERTQLWLFADGERRVFRMADTTARHVQALRRQGLDLTEVWTEILGGGGGALDIFVAAWWLAGMQLGLVEEFDKLLDMDFKSAPYVHWPSDEERESDGGGVLDPPA